MRKLKRKNKERKWCYLECGWIGFSALMISDVSFSVCGLQRGDRRLWRPLKPGNGLVFPPIPLHPHKNTLSLDVPINRPSRYTRLFFLIRFVVQWNNSPFQWRETQETSAKNGKKYLENRFRNNMDCISPSERFESYIYLNYWVNRTITTGDLRRDLKKKR